MATIQTLKGMWVIVKVLTLLACLFRADSGIAVRKLLYKKDMSEHCRRHVVPSVFLGRNVADAYSQIFQFSKLELPYSCYISVRTEAGSNIILVVQPLSEDNLKHSCSENVDQLLVYEMKEIFGGYWGQVPDTYINTEPTEVKFYTIKTTQTIVTTMPSPVEVVDPTAATPVDMNFNGNDDGMEYITVEIPLVNVSGELIADDIHTHKGFDMNENFDPNFDVAPRLGDMYETTILPLVQFSIEEQKNGRQREEDFHSRFQLNSDVFTPDSRLTYPRLNAGITKRRYASKYKYNINKRLKFIKNKWPYKIKDRFEANRIDATKRIIDNYISTQKNVYTLPYSIEINLNNINSGMANKFLRSNDDHQDFKVQENSLFKSNITRFISGIVNRKYNYSAYIYPKLDFTKKYLLVNKKINKITASSKPLSNRRNTMDYRLVRKTNKIKFINTDTIISTKSIPTINSEVVNVTVTSEKTNIFHQTPSLKLSATESKITEYHNESNIVKDQNITNTNEKKNDTILETIKVESNITTLYKVSESPRTASMVDRESWENVVKAAPVMAVRLNQTILEERVKGIAVTNLETSISGNKVKNKRNIKVTAIEEARPHKHITRRETNNITAVTEYQITNVQELRQFFELQYDSLQDRVALRYIDRYLGRSLFNICDYQEAKTRHVYLFNSSRIVIALKNFTMERMTMVMTPARTILNGQMRCSESHLECHVSSTRVCIDSMNACDGVPNCGAYDLYDEDSLMCGAAVGLQHNVFLAAVTFLAVILTMIYIVYYWLKRCLPKVSNAFFIYTDREENKLNLDSIMRSPNEIEETSKIMHKNILDDITIHQSQDKRRNYIICKWIIKCLTFQRFRKSSKKILGEVLEDQNVYTDKRFSFTDLELNKMTHVELTTISVQTGDSLEVAYLKKIKTNEDNVSMTQSMPPKHYERRESKSNITKEIIHHNSIQLFKEARSESVQSTNNYFKSPVELINRPRLAIDKEREIKSHLYDHVTCQGVSGITNTIMADIHSEKLTPTKPVIKHLRFDQDTTAIPSENIAQIPDENITSYNESKMDTEEPANTSSDFKRFWGKGKKSKKAASQLR